MGRTVYADELVKTYIGELIKRKQWHVGLILGQQSYQKDFVLHLARTPESSENDVCEESEVGTVEELPSNKKSLKSRPKSLSMCDEQWLSVHAVQVTRMLPGGLDVIGIFAVAPQTMLTESQRKLYHLVHSVHTAVTKNMPVLAGGAVTDRIILQVDSLSSKITCTSLDVSNVKNAVRPAEWRYGNSTKWLRLDSTVEVDLSLPLTKEYRLLKSMQLAIAPFCQDIWNSVALVNGEVRDDSELLATYPEGKRMKNRRTSVQTEETYPVDFLLPMHGAGDVPDPTVKDVMKILSVRGVIVCRAFVHWKAIVKEAIEAIKSDVIRTLSTRCELLSEDLELTDEASVSEYRQLFDTPVRVFTEMAGGAQLCDYKFGDEKLEEVTERIHELLDLRVSTEALEVKCEHHARANDWVTASHSQHDLSSSDNDIQSGQSKSSYSVTISLIVSGVIAVLAVVGSYFYLS